MTREPTRGGRRSPAPELAARRVVLVTAGASAVGAAVCRELARRGHAVVVGFRGHPEAARRVADGCARISRRPARAVHVDVTDTASLAAAIPSAWRGMGTLAGLVNVASYSSKTGDYRTGFARLDVNDVVRAVEVDLAGSLRVIQRCLPHLRAAGGAVVNFGSASANAADPDLLPYLGAKVGLAAYTRALARELGPRVRINTIAPGALDTDWMSTWRLPPGERKALITATCAGRLGTADEVARLVVWLLSDGAYVTGQTITIDGGMFCP
ncbi:MAG: SDR family oxidoreductase [Planctomycetes bacterium]|nr:SDR family oxidoreductase [Planctomycetota bacterium]